MHYFVDSSRSVAGRLLESRWLENSQEQKKQPSCRATLRRSQLSSPLAMTAYGIHKGRRGEGEEIGLKQAISFSDSKKNDDVDCCFKQACERTSI